MRCTAVLAEVKNNKLKYKSINTCITLLYTLHSKQLLTVEHIESKYLHPVQQSMVDNDGAQCGFCTPGFVMSMYAIHKNQTTKPPRIAPKLLPLPPTMTITQIKKV